MNPLHPDLMTTAERLDALCRLLAHGLVRLKARKSSELFHATENSSVDFTAHPRSHGKPDARENFP